MAGIPDVTSRIAQIQQRMAALSVAATRASAAASPGAPATSGSFAAAYTTAMSAYTGTTATTGTAATSASASPSTRLNADGIPAELAAYGNGKIPATALDSVNGTGHRLWAPAAKAMESMLAAAAKDGVKIGITDSYRSYDEQVDLAKRKGLYSQGGLAAKPGTSDHGWGRAVDLDLDSKAQAWMRTNGAKFGFVEDTPREPWHWVYTP